MKEIDFTKEVVCSDKSIKVLQVIPVNYQNSNFTHLIIYEHIGDGVQNACSVNTSTGRPSLGSALYDRDVTFLNPEPKVVSSNYRNVYPGGAVSDLFRTRKGADNISNPNRVAVIESLSFDDGTEKVNYIEV